MNGRYLRIGTFAALVVATIAKLLSASTKSAMTLLTLIVANTRNWQQRGYNAVHSAFRGNRVALRRTDRQPTAQDQFPSHAMARREHAMFGVTPNRIIRFAAWQWESLKSHLTEDDTCEQAGYALCKVESFDGGELYLVQQLILPDAGDLQIQHSGEIQPRKEFMAYVWFMAQVTGLSVLDIHTHCIHAQPCFSAIDLREANATRRIVLEHFPASITHLMVVMNSTATKMEGLVLDRQRRTYVPIDTIEALGRPNVIIRSAACIPTNATHLFSRQSLIPGWNQDLLAEQRVAIVGLGGNGGQLLPLLAGLGVGTRGGTWLIDADSVECSNVPRIPYAYATDINRSKVSVAAEYLSKKAGITSTIFVDSAAEKHVQDALKGCTLLFGCGDNDGVRHILNTLSVRYLIPYIDLGCEVLLKNDLTFDAVGQVRTVIPGRTACLICCNGYDVAMAALESASTAELKIRERAGYVKDHPEIVTPSVANLNAAIAQLAVNQLLGLTQGSNFGAWDHCYYDGLKAKLTPATSHRRNDCPLCGTDGTLGQGAIMSGRSDDGFLDVCQGNDAFSAAVVSG